MQFHTNDSEDITSFAPKQVMNIIAILNSNIGTVCASYQRFLHTHKLQVRAKTLAICDYESLRSKVSSFHQAKKTYALLTPITDAINHAICHVSVLLFLNSVFVPISYVVIPFII
jgi:hypothetical protein